MHLFIIYKLLFMRVCVLLYGIHVYLCIYLQHIDTIAKNIIDGIDDKCFNHNFSLIKKSALSISTM